MTQATVQERAVIAAEPGALRRELRESALLFLLALAVTVGVAGLGTLL